MVGKVAKSWQPKNLNWFLHIEKGKSLLKIILIVVALGVLARRFIGFKLRSWLRTKSPAKNPQNSNLTDEGMARIEINRVAGFGFDAFINSTTGFCSYITPGPRERGLFPDPWSAYRAALKITVDRKLEVISIGPSDFNPDGPPETLNVKIVIEDFGDKAFAKITSLDYESDDWEYFDHKVYDTHFLSTEFLNTYEAHQVALGITETYGYNVRYTKTIDCLSELPAN